MYFFYFSLTSLTFPLNFPPSPPLYFYESPFLLALFYSLNLNYTWTKDEYTFDYYVGVCVVPLSTPLSGCYAIQKTTQPDGVASFTCVGKDLEVQVTDTKGTCS